MKKLLVLFLVIALVISLCAFSCDSKATEGDTVTENTTQTKSGNKVPADILIDWMLGGTYYMKYTADVEAEGMTMTMKGIMAVQGDNISSTSEMNVAGQAVKSRMLVLDRTTYIIDDSLKMIMKSPVSF